MHVPFFLRDARPDERAAIHELTMAAYAEYATVMAPRAWASLRAALLATLATEQQVERIVAERAGTLIGSVMLFPPATNVYDEADVEMNVPELRLLAVATEARGYGVGKALVAECIRRATLAGASALGLHTSKSLTVAIRMYEHMGFVRDPERDFQPDGAELVMAYRRPIGSATNNTP